MPALQYWFTGAGFGAFIVFAGGVISLGYNWYSVAATAANSLAERISFTLRISAEVNPLDVTGTDDRQQWTLMVKNTAAQPLQYGQITFHATLDGAQIQANPGNGAIIQSGETLSYTFPFAGKYERRDGKLDVEIDVSYGAPSQPPIRKLVQKTQVTFRPRGAITESSSREISREEVAL